jgi:hypothetical protein
MVLVSLALALADAQALLAPQRPAVEQPGGVHLHLHGVTVEEIAAILARRTDQL